MFWPVSMCHPHELNSLKIEETFISFHFQKNRQGVYTSPAAERKENKWNLENKLSKSIIEFDTVSLWICEPNKTITYLVPEIQICSCFYTLYFCVCSMSLSQFGESPCNQLVLTTLTVPLVMHQLKKIYNRKKWSRSSNCMLI